MHQKPDVSIAIISYNQENFIANAIESALSQDYDNYEIVISDDFSTDNTLNIVNSYQMKYPDKIKVLCNSQNYGPVINWFNCTHQCSGKYIIGLAGDDELISNAISLLYSVMKNDDNIAICYADAVVVQQENNKILYKLSDKTPCNSGNIKTALSDAIYYSPATMFCSKLLPKENLFKDIKFGADLCFFKELMILSAPNGLIKYVPEVIYKYKKHTQNITVTNNLYRKDHIDGIKLLQNKYPNYHEYLNPSIYDFCCINFIKSIINLQLSKGWYFLLEGLKASNYNIFKFLRPIIWGIKFFCKK